MLKESTELARCLHSSIIHHATLCVLNHYIFLFIQVFNFQFIDFIPIIKFVKCFAKFKPT